MIAGPKLGDGPRWNLGRAVEGKKRVDKEDVEREHELILWMHNFFFQDEWSHDARKEMKDYFETNVGRRLEPSELEGMEEGMEEFCEKVASAGTTRAYIKQLKDENRILKEGSDARCTRMLQQALEGSDDADVDFVFDSGQIGGVKGHQVMLCAWSEVYAGLFRSGMVEAQEGKIRVPPVIGVASFRGFLEWLYLGECVECFCSSCFD